MKCFFVPHALFFNLRKYDMEKFSHQAIMMQGSLANLTDSSQQTSLSIQAKPAKVEYHIRP
jgi:hypothetical protein